MATDEDFEALYEYLSSTFTPDRPVPELPELLQSWTSNQSELRLHCLVGEERRAWHAGESYWGEATDPQRALDGIVLDGILRLPKKPACEAQRWQ